jgi:redox-sensing transcriptional repressor
MFRGERILLKTEKIPEATITRLSVYSRHLNSLEQSGVTTVSSQDISMVIDGSPAQVRKDLAYFGEFGTRGVGYDVKDLNRNLKKILGLSHSWKVVIVGAGNLGSALCQYKGFLDRGFNILAAFDRDMSKAGAFLNQVPIYPMYKLDEFVRQNQVTIGVVAVPAASAQETVDILVRAGVSGILNFAPKAVATPGDVELRSVDLSVNMEILSFYLGLRELEPAKWRQRNEAERDSGDFGGEQSGY